MYAPNGKKDGNPVHGFVWDEMRRCYIEPVDRVCERVEALSGLCE
jgi:hypothetical protein